MDFLRLSTKQLDDEGGDQYLLEGIGLTRNKDRQNDILGKGALINPGVELPLLWNHDTNQVIGNIIELKEVEEGIYIKATLPKDAQLVRDLIAPQLKNRSIKDFSIGYKVHKQKYDKEEKATILQSIELFEVSLVAIGADPNTKILSFKKNDSEEIVLTVTDIKNMSKSDLSYAIKNGMEFSRKASDYLSNGVVNYIQHKADEEDENENQILEETEQMPETIMIDGVEYKLTPVEDVVEEKEDEVEEEVDKEEEDNLEKALKNLNKKFK